MFYCARVAGSSKKATGLAFDGYGHGGKHRWRWRTPAALIAASALLLLPPLALAQSGGGQYEPTPPKPCPSCGQGGGGSGNPVGGGTGSAPSAGGPAAEVPEAVGDTRGSRGVGASGVGGSGAADDPSLHEGSATGSVAAQTDDQDRARDALGREDLRLAKVDTVADLARPPAALGAQAVPEGSMGIAPLVLGLLLLVAAFAILLRRLVAGRGASG